MWSRLPSAKRAAWDEQRQAEEQALLQRFAPLVGSGLTVTPVRNDPPDFLLTSATTGLGVELTEVKPERLGPDIKFTTVTGALAHDDPQTGSKALEQSRFRRQIEEGAHAAYTGAPAEVDARWSEWEQLRARDVARLSMALRSVIGAVTAAAPHGEIHLEWEDLRSTPLTSWVDDLWVRWGASVQPLWDSGGGQSEVTPEAIRQTIAGKESALNRWSETVDCKVLLMTLNLRGGRLLDSAAELTYLSRFHAIYCHDAFGGFRQLRSR